MKISFNAELLEINCFVLFEPQFIEIELENYKYLYKEAE